MKTIYTKYMMIGLLVSMPLFSMERQEQAFDLAFSADRQRIVDLDKQYIAGALKKNEDQKHVDKKHADYIQFLKQAFSKAQEVREGSAFYSDGSYGEDIKNFALNALQNAEEVQRKVQQEQAFISQNVQQKQSVQSYWKQFESDVNNCKKEIQKLLNSAISSMRSINKELERSRQELALMRQELSKLQERAKKNKGCGYKDQERMNVLQQKIVELGETIPEVRARYQAEAAVAIGEEQRIEAERLEAARIERMLQQEDDLRAQALIHHDEGLAKYIREMQQEDALNEQALIHHNEALRMYTVAQQGGSRNSGYLPALDVIDPGMGNDHEAPAPVAPVEDEDPVVLPAEAAPVAPSPEPLVAPMDAPLLNPALPGELSAIQRLNAMPGETKMHKALRFGTIGAGVVATIATAIIVQRLSKRWSFSAVSAILGSAATYLAHRWIAKRA
jgi:hypothetical protein